MLFFSQDFRVDCISVVDCICVQGKTYGRMQVCGRVLIYLVIHELQVFTKDDLWE